jgi:hypothetical protein
MTLFDSDDNLPIAETDADLGDKVHALTRAAFGAIPVLGALAAEFWNVAVVPPLVRRQQEFVDDLAARVRLLEKQHGLNFDRLSRIPAFTDALLFSLRVASYTSQTEKVRALRNAVLNSALRGSPEVAIQQMFMSLTERFTDRHLVVLKLFQDAAAWRTQDGAGLPQRSSASAILFDAFPDARLHEPLYRQLWTDLHAAGLVKLPVLENGPEGDARRIRRTTDLGDQYLSFISSPVAD